MKRKKFVLKILAILPCVLLMFSCQIRDEHSSDSILLVTEVIGHTDNGDAADFLQSKYGARSDVPEQNIYSYV